MECRKYYHYINFLHLKSCCGLSIEEYRIKYKNVSLVSESYRKNASKNRKGKTSWNKGLTNIYSKKTINKMSKAKKGKKFSNKHKQNLSKTHKGLKFSKETKDKMSKIKKGRKREKFTEQHCKNISKGLKDRKLSNETRKKQRISAIKRIEDRYGQIFPNYNLKACEIFEYLNKTFNLNGIHALNRGEYFIKELGYWLDYYETDLNLVIEYDEKHHKYYKEKDKIREKEIKEFLNCKFIRIKENEFDNMDEILLYVKNKF